MKKEKRCLSLGDHTHIHCWWPKFNSPGTRLIRHVTYSSFHPLVFLLYIYYLDINPKCISPDGPYPVPFPYSLLPHSVLPIVFTTVHSSILVTCSAQFSSVQFSHSVMSDSLWPHELQHARLPCPSPTPGVYSNSCPLSRWCHPAISTKHCINVGYCYCYILNASCSLPYTSTVQLPKN